MQYAIFIVSLSFNGTIGEVIDVGTIYFAVFKIDATYYLAI